jgi:hypothetical protein
MQPSSEAPPGANFPSIPPGPLGKRARRRHLYRQLVLRLKRPDYDRLRALRPHFAGDSPPKIARRLVLLALAQIEQQSSDSQPALQGGAQ